MTLQNLLMLVFLAVAVCIASAGVGTAGEVTLTLEGITTDELPNSAIDVDISDNYAYVADFTNGLVIVDISDPANPTTVGNYPSRIGNYGYTAAAIGVAVSGNYAYVANWYDDLYIIDVTDKANPTLATTYNTGDGADKVTISGDHAYISSQWDGVDIIDISDPTNPVFVSNFDTDDLAEDVAILNDYAYIADRDDGVIIVDISDPANPSFIGSCDTPYDANSIVVSGTCAYVADADDTLIIDISNPAAPAIVGQYNTADSWGIAIAANYVYVGDGDNGVVVLNVNDPVNPVLAGSYDTMGYAGRLDIVGDLVYVADGHLVILRTDSSSTSSPVHNTNKGTDYPTIQAAIDDADIGDEIHVDSGTYYENVVVNKQLTLRGIDTGAGMPVVDAGRNGDVITISANGCLLDGFVATNSGLSEDDAGIEVTSNNNVIRNNTVSNNKAGIDLTSSNDNILSNNIVISNSYPGICLTSSDNNIVFTNTVNLNAYYGIELYLSGNNTVIDNIANSNTRYGIFVWNSNNNNRMISNTANDNVHAGIRFYSSSNNVVSGNSLAGTKSGISMYGSNDNAIFDNNVSFNENGIGLDQSSNNIIYHNNLIQNTNQASDNLGPNTWDFSYPSGGNYWSDYTGTDSDGDGIGDTPYPIPGGGSVDRYPLMEPWSEPTPTGPVHNINKGTDYTTIQAAINDANIGDEIHVDSGTYYENVVIDKHIILRGINTGAGKPIIDLNGKEVHGFEFAADGIILDGFIVTNSKYLGIYVYSSNNIILNNTFNNTNGITLYSSSYNNLTNNKFLNGGLFVSLSHSNTIENNIVNSKPLVYLEDSSDYVVEEAGQVILLNCNNITIENLDLSNASVGIQLWHTNNSLISNNLIKNNNIHGIASLFSNNNTFIDNTVDNSSYGIYLFSSSNNNLTNNIFLNDGLLVSDSYSNTIENNIVNRKPLVYLEDSSDYVVEEAGQVIIVNSNNIIIENLDLSNASVGIQLWNTNNCVISKNLFNNNRQGIRQSLSNNNTFVGNIANKNYVGFQIQQSNNNTYSKNAVNNNSYGMVLSSSSNNTLIGNSVNNNSLGIYLSYSSYNDIYLNNFINNDAEVYSGSNNFDNGYPIGGNYWSSYTGDDLKSGPNQDQPDSDGIGDTPYPIPGGSSVDRYPLMAPYTPHTGPSDRSLVQVEGQPEVYWFQNNRLYWVTDWNVINAMSGVPGWDSVNTMPASEFNPADYPQGPRFITTGAESDGLLIRQVGDYKVYHIENGKKRHITYPDVMDLKGYSFDDVIEVSPAISGMFSLGDPIGIEVDVYFNKKTDSGDISHVSQFTSAETVKSITETTVVEEYTVETYVKMIKPDGTEKYAYRERSDFLQTDDFLFSDTKKSLYPGTWQAQTKTWNWDEYTFAGDEMEGVYTWEFWYEDMASGKVLGKDVQGYEFTNTPPSPDDTTPPFVLIISPVDGKTVFHSNLLRMYGTVFDPSGIETLTINGQDVISVQAFGVVPFYTYVNLNEGLNKITILAKDASENHNGKIEEITVSYYPFNVEITSPNDLDRLIPGESINGEVFGGTSPFEYKWIINEVEHFGTSDYIFSESGKYNVKLEVTDDKGYSIKTEEKQIIVSPLNVGSTFGFRPNPNGYNFSNFARDDYSWEMFRNTYGANQVEFADGTNISSAEHFYEKHFRHTGKNGTCFGMSASSLVTYQEDDGTNNYRSWDLGDDITNPLPSWPFFPSFVSTTQDLVEYYHPLYRSKAGLADLYFTYNDQITVYDEIKLRMANTWINDPMIIGGNPGSGPHFVVPYKIEESSDHRTGTVYVYDNKFPGEERIIKFDLLKGTVDWGYIQGLSLSSIQVPPLPEMWTDFDTISQDGHLLYEDSVGRHYGNYDGEFKEEIPGIFRIDSWGQIEDNQFTEIYYMPNLNFKRNLYGINDGMATVSISRANSLVIADVQVSPNSVDELNVPADGSSVEFISGEGTSSLSLMLDRENTDMARFARINISGIESENRLQLLFSGDDNNVSMKNEGSQKECDIYLEQIGFSGSYGYLRDIVIEENSSIRITPLDWNDITNNLIMVEHDIGNDGTIEYTETLPSLDIKPPSSITNLHSTTGTTYLNWTWTNPPDPDFNHTEIYLDGVFQTITSAEHFNATDLAPETSYTISTRTVDTSGNINQTWVNDTATTLKIYNITFLPPITTTDQFNLTNGRTFPIKFTARDDDTGEFIYDDTVNVTITNSTGHLIAFFTNGTDTDSVRINSTEEQYIVNFHTKNYDLNVGEIYTIHVTFGEADAPQGYAITHFTIV